MNRRQFLVGAGTLATGLLPLRVLGNEPDGEKADPIAPPCGLYCPSCSDYSKGWCHGCGCGCGKCAGNAHADGCEISKCAKKHKVEHCGLCRDFPCTKLIGFTFDPIWITHQTCLENLRRRKRVGTKVWLSEQKELWTQDRIKASVFVENECAERAKKLKDNG